MSAQPKRPRSRTRNTKENGVTDKPDSPKPLIRQASSMKLPVSKLKKDDLVKQNNDLQKQLNAMTIQNQALREKLTTLTDIVYENAKIKGLEPSTAVKETMEIPTGRLVSWLDELLMEEDKSSQNTVETRVEELETRTTHLTMEVARMVQLGLQIENGLEEIQDTECLEEAHKRARMLFYETSEFKECWMKQQHSHFSGT